MLSLLQATESHSAPVKGEKPRVKGESGRSASFKRERDPEVEEILGSARPVRRQRRSRPEYVDLIED